MLIGLLLWYSLNSLDLQSLTAMLVSKGYVVKKS